MKLTGILIFEGRHLKTAVAQCFDPNKDFHDRLEESFILLCKELHISVPLWLSKNTKELAMCKKTFFTNDQFNDEILFDKFEMRIDKI